MRYNNGIECLNLYDPSYNTSGPFNSLMQFPGVMFRPASAWSLQIPRRGALHDKKSPIYEDNSNFYSFNIPIRIPRSVITSYKTLTPASLLNLWSTRHKDQFWLFFFIESKDIIYLYRLRKVVFVHSCSSDDKYCIQHHYPRSVDSFWCCLQAIYYIRLLSEAHEVKRAVLSLLGKDSH